LFDLFDKVGRDGEISVKENEAVSEAIKSLNLKQPKDLPQPEKPNSRA